MEAQKSKLKFPIGSILLLIYSLLALIGDISYFTYLFSDIFQESFSSKTISAILEFFFELGYIVLLFALAILPLMKKKGKGIVILSFLFAANWILSFASLLFAEGIEILEYNWNSFIACLLWATAFVALALMELADMGVKSLAPLRAAAKLVFPIAVGVSFIFIPVLTFINNEYFSIVNLISQILLRVAMILIWSWLANQMPKSVEAPREGEAAPAATAMPAAMGDGFVSLCAHIALLMFTCGIWMLVWIYKATEFTNRAEGELPRSGAACLLLFLFIPFYSIAWLYLTGKRIDKIAAAKGIRSDIAAPCLLLAFLMPPVAPVLMQEKINECAFAE